MLKSGSTMRARTSALVLFGFTAAWSATPALADNEYASLQATTCGPNVAGGCMQGSSQTPLASGVNIGGGFAFASGYRGGYALASAVFAPGAAPLLQSGIYSNSALADYGYSFRVLGDANTLPNALVPLRIFARVSTSPIRFTDKNGQVVDLVDGILDPAPTKQFKVVSNAYMTVTPTRLSSNPKSGANISVTSAYTLGGAGPASCRNCDGTGSVFNDTIWVYANSDIYVNVDANVLLEYAALGGGLDPLRTFATVSATADPIFTIDDPAYANFSIVGVPSGFAPPSASDVPEPATWAMMILGFGAIGGIMRARRDPTIAIE